MNKSSKGIKACLDSQGLTNNFGRIMILYALSFLRRDPKTSV